jgi:ABC-type branched-subunit amino acid transport system substrate-binding protein
MMASRASAARKGSGIIKMTGRSWYRGQALRAVTVTGLLAVMLSGCTGGGAGGEIHIGVAVSSFGPSAAVKEEVVRGVETAVAQINSAGGIKARHLKVVVEESGSDKETGLKAVHKLIDTEKAALIVNGTRSDVFANWAEYARSKDVLVINATASNPLIDRLGGTVYTVTVAHAELGRQLAKWVYESGYRKVAILYPVGQLGSELQRGVSEGLRRLGGAVVASVGYEAGRADYSSDLARVASERPDAVIACLSGEDGKLLFRQAAQARMAGPWYLAYPSQLKVEDPSLADGRVFGVEVAYTQPSAEKFRTHYTSRYENATPSPWAAYSFDGTWMVAYAMRRVGTEASQMARVFTWGAKGYAGATGILVFDKHGHRTAPQFERLKVSSDGKLVPAK